jgi:hypothetical protein
MIEDRPEEKVKQKKKGKQFPYSSVLNAFAKQRREEPTL